MIYMTNYNPLTKKCTAPSVDSGFETLEDVGLMMGEPAHIKETHLMYVQSEEEGVVFSKVPFRMEKSDE